MTYEVIIRIHTFILVMYLLTKIVLHTRDVKKLIIRDMICTTMICINLAIAIAIIDKFKIVMDALMVIINIYSLEINKSVIQKRKE